MSTRFKILLIIIAVVSFAIALSYPIIFTMNEYTNNANNARLAALRAAGRATAAPEATDATEAPEATEVPNATDVPNAAEAPHATEAPNATDTPDATDVPNATVAPNATAAPVATDTIEATEAPAAQGESSASSEERIAYVRETRSPAPTPSLASGATPAPTPVPTPSPSPSPTPDRRIRTGALSYPEKEHVVFDEANILPEFCEMYALNHDLVGWISIPGMVIDFPVVQSEDSEYYLTHDFFGEKNKNGQIILDARCDPYTPSYNLVLSGHNMYNDSMFSSLIKYRRKDFWQEHKTLTFDVLTERRSYVVFAAFFSGDYDVDEEGFRYNVDIQYRMDAEQWLAEIRENQVFDTGIDVAFGDEFLTLTTCNHFYREHGRFVVVCRRIREGEVF